MSSMEETPLSKVDHGVEVTTPVAEPSQVNSGDGVTDVSGGAPVVNEMEGKTDLDWEDAEGNDERASTKPRIKIGCPTPKKRYPRRSARQLNGPEKPKPKSKCENKCHIELGVLRSENVLLKNAISTLEARVM